MVARLRVTCVTCTCALTYIHVKINYPYSLPIGTTGVRPLLHTYVVDVIMETPEEGGAGARPVITGVIVECKSGRMAIRAKRVIDCSGDADVAYFAGAKFRTCSVCVFVCIKLHVCNALSSR